jgi:hypothetical protein
LTEHTGNPMSPAFCVVAAAAISSFTVLTLPETVGRPIATVR